MLPYPFPNLLTSKPDLLIPGQVCVWVTNDESTAAPCLLSRKSEMGSLGGVTLGHILRSFTQHCNVMNREEQENQGKFGIPFEAISS